MGQSSTTHKPAHYDWTHPSIPTRYLSLDELRTLGEMSNTRQHTYDSLIRTPAMDLYGSSISVSDRPNKVDVYPHMGDTFYQRSARAYPVKTKTYNEHYSGSNYIPRTRQNLVTLRKPIRVSAMMGQITVPL